MMRAAENDAHFTQNSPPAVRPGAVCWKKSLQEKAWDARLREPPYDPAGVPDGDAVFRNRARDDAPGSDDAVLPDGDAGQKDRAAADPRAVFDRDGFCSGV